MGKKNKPKKKYLDQASLYSWDFPSYEPKTVSFNRMPDVVEYDFPPPIPDLVKHPPHYTEQVPGVECKDVIGYFPGHIAAAMKYLWRHQSKGRPVEDLRKAIEFITFEIERLERDGIEDDISSADGH